MTNECVYDLLKLSRISFSDFSKINMLSYLSFMWILCSDCLTSHISIRIFRLIGNNALFATALMVGGTRGRIGLLELHASVLGNRFQIWEIGREMGA